MAETTAGTYGGGGAAVTAARAGFWVRFAAALVDGVILGVVNVALLEAIGGAGSAISILVNIAYFAYFEGGPSGQTVGKRALGIRVIRLDGGGPLGTGNAIVRWAGRILSAVVVLLGYLWMLWDREKQTWHDKFAGSVVVPVSAAPVDRWPG